MVFWKVLEALGEVWEGVRRGLGRSGQAIGRFDCVLYASWECLGASWERLVGFWRRLEANFDRRWGFQRTLTGAQGRLMPHFPRVQACFGMAFLCFFVVASQNGELVKMLIFLRKNWYSIAIPQGGPPPPPNLGKASWGRRRQTRKEPQGKRCVPHLSSCVAKCGKLNKRKQECIPTIVSAWPQTWDPEVFKKPSKNRPRAFQNLFRCLPNPSKIEFGASQNEFAALQDAIFHRHLM